MKEGTDGVINSTPFCALFAILLLSSVVAAIAASFTIVILWPSDALARTDGTSVDGLHGTLHIHGLLAVAPCVLEMNTQEQSVDMGSTSITQLHRVGDRGDPVSFAIKLRDCLHSSGQQLDERTVVKTWANDQPVVSITFLGPANNDNPQLVQIKGVEGVGLRITDSLNRDIRLGSRGPVQRLEPGDNELVYYATPERTKATLKKGRYFARVNFSLNYD
jgi:type 1 fimbria pilin